MGRKAVPVEIRKVRGNPSRRPIPKEMKPVAGKLIPDKDLCKVAKAKYQELIKHTHWGLVVTLADNDQLCEYCRLHARKVAAEKKVKDEGEVITTTDGNYIQHPHLAVVNRCRADMKKIASEFGGTPASRVKIGVLVKDDKEDELTQLIG